MDWMVQTRDLGKTYKRADGTLEHAVHDLNLEIATGEIFGCSAPTARAKPLPSP